MVMLLLKYLLFDKKNIEFTGAWNSLLLFLLHAQIQEFSSGVCVCVWGGGGCPGPPDNF